MSYTKLFSEIIFSTIWREPNHIRILWITMLALRNQYHKVEASIPGLADAAKISLEECEEALIILSSPDKYSRSQDYEGRRIEECNGGWLILNAEKYRKKMSADERRKYKTEKQREYRANAKVDKSVDPGGPSGHSRVEQSRVENKTYKAWTPDEETLTACKFAGVTPTEAMISTYRLKILDWKDKGYNSVNLRTKFVSHCKGMQNTEEPRRPIDNKSIETCPDCRSGLNSRTHQENCLQENLS